MKAMASTMMALTLTLLLAAPVLAGGDGRSDTVTKTYKLTVHGNVDAAEDRVFFVEHSAEGDATAEHPLFIRFCGPDFSSLVPEPGFTFPKASNYKTECAGNDAEYIASVRMKRGSRLYFGFSTALLSDLRSGREPQTFFTTNSGDEVEDPGDFETINADTTNTAWFRFGETDQQMPGMPATGAGGMPGSGVPAGSAAALALLTAGGYAVRRRR